MTEFRWATLLRLLIKTKKTGKRKKKTETRGFQEEKGGALRAGPTNIF